MCAGMPLPVRKFATSSAKLLQLLWNKSVPVEGRVSDCGGMRGELQEPQAPAPHVGTKSHWADAGALTIRLGCVLMPAQGRNARVRSMQPGESRIRVWGTALAPFRSRHPDGAWYAAGRSLDAPDCGEECMQLGCGLGCGAKLNLLRGLQLEVSQLRETRGIRCRECCSILGHTGASPLKHVGGPGFHPRRSIPARKLPPRCARCHLRMSR